MKVETRRLDGKRVGVLLADGFEWVEVAPVLRVLEAAGASIDVISLRRGKVRGMNVTIPAGRVRARRTFAEADPTSYDAVYIPGGFVGPDLLRQSADARDFIRAADAQGKAIATLSHGPWLLVSADIVQGRTLAAWPGVRDDIVHAGGVWKDEPVVRDQNWISSRGPQDLRELIPAMLDHFASIIALERLGEEATRMDLDAISSPQYEEPLRFPVVAARASPLLLAGATLTGLLGLIWVLRARYAR